MIENPLALAARWREPLFERATCSSLTRALQDTGMSCLVGSGRTSKVSD